MSEGRLEGHREIWQSKPVLREIYEDLYRRIAAACVAGRTLEIGGGTGNLKAFAPDVVSSDIQPAAWLDIACDAHRLPFAEATFHNIVLFDVLHHLARPRLFFDQARHVLARQGRLVMVEPAITLASLPFYHWFHEEPVRLGENPLGEGALPGSRDPYDANQAIPSLLFGPLFGRHRRRFEVAFPEFAIRDVRPVSLFAYPLSGGFRRWSLVPAAAVGPLLRIEALLAPVLGPIFAFRLIVVLERR